MVAWSTPLGAAVALFLVAGAFHLMIGVLTPIGMARRWMPDVFIYNAEADRAIFGKAADELRRNADVVKLRDITLGMVSGLLVGVGLLEMALAWYGLGAGATWALAVLVGAESAMGIFWAVGHRLWRETGFVGGLGALQPFQYVPAFLTVAAAVLAWVGMRG